MRRRGIPWCDMGQFEIRNVLVVFSWILGVICLLLSITAGGIVYRKHSMNKSTLLLFLLLFLFFFFIGLGLFISSPKETSWLVMYLPMVFILLVAYYLFGLLKIWIIERIRKHKK